MLLQFSNMPHIHPYPEWVTNSSHCLWQFSTSASLSFSYFRVGSLPSKLPLIPHSELPVFPPAISALMPLHPPLLAPTASALCELFHTRFHALMRYSNSPSIPIIATRLPQPFFIPPTSAFQHRFYPTDLLHHHTL